MNIAINIFLSFFCIVSLIFFLWSIWSLIKTLKINRLQTSINKLKFAVEETMDELGSFQIISRKYDVEEKLFQIETSIEIMIDEIKESPPKKISDMENYYLKFKEITDKLIDYCDKPEKYFKEISTAEEG